MNKNKTLIMKFYGREAAKIAGHHKGAGMFSMQDCR